MTTEETLINLRYIANKHKNDKVFTFGTNITDMANDCIKAIEELLAPLTWTPVTEKLPIGPEYDWVLVKCEFVPEGGFTVPHMAELRNGVWYSDHCDGPMEETLAIKVVAWFDTQTIKDKEDFI